MKDIIVLCGKKRVGKDTIADYIVKKYGYKKIAFADKLKDVCCMLFDLNKEDMENHKDDILPSLNVTYRHIMQSIGMMFVKNGNIILPNIDKTFWCRLIKFDKNEKIIITDCRNDAEQMYMTQFNPLFIHVTKKDKLSDKFDDKHFTVNTDKMITIHNDESIESLYELVDTIMN